MRVYRRLTNPVPDGAAISKPTRAGIASASWRDKSRRLHYHDCQRDKEGIWRILSPCYYARIRSETGTYTLMATGLDDLESATNWAIERQKEHDLVRAGLQTKQGIISHKSNQAPYLDHVRAYLDDLKLRAGTDHVKAVEYRLNRLAKELGYKRLTDIDPIQINAWAAKTAAAGESNRSVNCYLIAMSAMMRWAEAAGRTTIVLKGLRKLPDKATRPRRALTPDEFERLVEAAIKRKAPARAMVYRVAAGTGLRKEELAQLTVDQIVLDGAPAIRLRAEHTKNGKADILPMSADLSARLAEFIGDRKDGRLFDRIPRPLTLHKDLKAAGIKRVDPKAGNVDFHSLRKTYVTWLIIAGVNPRTIQALARHADIRMTMGAYTDTSQLPTRAGVDMLGNFLTSYGTSTSTPTRKTNQSGDLAKVERKHGVQEAGGSNPLAPTTLGPTGSELTESLKKGAGSADPPSNRSLLHDSLTTYGTTTSGMTKADLLKLMAEILHALDE